MKKLTTVAASAAIVASFTAGNAMASKNPFGIQQLDSGTHVAMSGGTCGEGKWVMARIKVMAVKIKQTKVNVAALHK